MDQFLHFLNLDTFQASDLLVVAALVVLEGLLSCDNAVALAMVVRRLPREQQGHALRYGLVGAYLFLIVALLAASWIISQWYLKMLGGSYLLWVAISHLIKGPAPAATEADAATPGGRRLLWLSPFWSTVLLVELTDMAFSVDSIAAAVGLSSKLWVLILGSMMAVLVMRFVAQGFVLLLRRHPRLETAAFIAVAVIGLKLVLEFPLDVVGLSQPQPPASADDQPRMEQVHTRAWIQIPHVLTINAAALPEPQRVRFANADDYGEARRRWNLHGRSFIHIEEIPSSLLLVAIFTCGFLPRRRPPAAAT